MHSFISVFWLALAAIGAVPVSPKIEVKQHGPNNFTIVLNGFDDDERASQAVISPVAADVCGSKHPVFGKFEFRREVTVGNRSSKVPARFVQDIGCSATVTENIPQLTMPVKPDAEIEASARVAALAFLDAYDRGDGPASWKMFGAAMQEQQPLPKWSADARGHAAELGINVSRTIVKLTWYTDPPGVVPGTYVAADFVGASARKGLMCGYVALFRERDHWSVVRIETGSLPREMLKSAKPEMLARLKQELRCVDS